jgi:hypothetical protein
MPKAKIKTKKRDSEEQLKLFRGDLFARFKGVINVTDQMVHFNNT